MGGDGAGQGAVCRLIGGGFLGEMEISACMAGDPPFSTTIDSEDLKDSSKYSRYSTTTRTHTDERLHI